ncbi:protein NDR1, partial [Corchorus capsularis]
MGALVTLAYLVLHLSMKLDTWSFAPFIDLQSGSIPKLNISSSTNLTTTIGLNLTFGSKSCNYETIFYKGINATISYKDDRALANVSMEPFGLGNNE